MADQSLISRLDASIGKFFAQWNTASTIIVGLLVIVIVYPLFVSAEPDIHPFLLARQAASSPIRHPGESATYRSTDIPYGYPLRSGLAIKDSGASTWATGRDGDLRDIWRQAVNGPAAKINTVLGTEKVVQHDLSDITKEINIIGNFVKKTGATKVAVCLSNSIEFLTLIFASSFYSFSIVLIPHSQDSDETTSLLSTVEFDTLFAEAGSISLETLLSSRKSLHRLIWVARAGGKEAIWDELPDDLATPDASLDVKTWRDIIEHDPSASKEVPALDPDTSVLPISILSPTKSGNFELVDYSHANIVSAVAALNSSASRVHKLTNTDSLLLTVPLSTTYALTWALLTLFSGATLLLTSVASSEINLLSATKSARQLLKPTHIVADARVIPAFIDDLEAAAADGGVSAKYARWSLNRSLVQGIMPAHASKPSYLPPSLSNLKALYIVLPSSIPASERPTSSALATLRLLLHARVALALTAGPVAGYVAQSNILDYRDKGSVVSVGAVASCIELHLTGDEKDMATVDGAGRLVVKGPAVAAAKGEKKVIDGLLARIGADNTVELVADS